MIFIVIFILEIIVLYFLSRKVTSKVFNKVHNIYIFAILFLPGTFIHEISHFLTALILLVPVGQPEFFPKKMENGIKMGSVPIGKTDPIRRTIIGIAPIIFGLAIILGSVFYVYQNDLLKTPLALVILAYIVFQVGNTMFSSKKDMEGSFITFILIALIYIIIYLIGVRITLNINPEIFKKTDLFLLIPIGINLLFF